MVTVGSFRILQGLGGGSRHGAGKFIMNSKSQTPLPVVTHTAQKNVHTPTRTHVNKLHTYIIICHTIPTA